MQPGKVRIFKFGSFIVDGERQQLFKDGIPTSIQRKLYEILFVLVENAGTLVTKEDLIDTVWLGKEIDERNLTQHIYNLRRVLGDNPRQPSFILTIPGKGYTFNHPVKLIDQTEMEMLLNQSPELEIAPPAPSGKRRADRWLSRYARWAFSRLRSWQFLAAVGGALILGILLVAHPSWWSRSKSPSAPYPSVVTMSTISGFKTDPIFSPDGQQIAFSSGQSGSSLDIFITSINAGSARQPIQLTNNPLPEHNPVWSPDGQKIAYLRGDKFDQAKTDLMIASASGGGEKLIAKVWGGLDWSPDGRYLAVIDEDSPDTPSSVYLISSDGTERMRLTEPVPGEWRYDSTPRFSPDGQSIAFIRWRGDFDGDIWVVDLRTRKQRQITSDRMVIADLRWSADGKEILFLSGRSGVMLLWRQQIDEPTPVLIDSLVSDIFRFDVHPFQKRIVFTQYSQNTTIEVWPLDRGKGAVNQPSQGWTCKIDTNTKNLNSRFNSFSKSVFSIGTSRNFLNPRFSPNGKQLLFISNLTGRNQIWVAKDDCTEPLQLTNLDFDGVGSPRWSPDGRQIVFDGRKSGPADVYVIDADGNNLRLITEGYMPSWSADGRFIYFVSNRRRLPQVWKIPVVGGAAIKVTETQSRDPIESADGRTLYFTKVDQLWQKNLESGLESPVLGLEDQTISRYWDLTPNGIYVALAAEKSNSFQLSHLDLRTNRLQMLLELKGVIAKWVPGISVKPGGDVISVSSISNVLGDIQLLDNWN